MPQRFFIALSYLGSRYSGWQVQPNAPSVQATLETAMGILLRQPIGVTGCGRTDTGVHAQYYVAHFDAENKLPANFLIRLNGLLPQDIAVHSVAPVHADAHARFDAFERSYEYHIALRKDPFAQQTTWFYPHFSRLDLEKMHGLAGLLPRYEHFYPFCKTHGGADSYACALKEARWEHRPEEHRLVFYISANRFLRGMVRLIVGAGISVGKGQLELSDVAAALDRQKALKKSWSVPPEGLFLTGVKYPFEFYT